jgi:hypothetical protein
MTDSRRVSICIAALICILVVAGSGAGAAEVPRFAEVTGHDFGESITVHHEMVAYLERLAETSPRVVTHDQGVTWEGRRLLLAIVTSPANHARLDEIRANAQRLGDPRRTNAEEARRITAEQPAILYMGGSIHGFELSGAEGVLKLLERLATAEDAETLEVLDNTVILLDPMLNPDGRDAFAWRNLQTLGREPSAERDDWSNDFNRWEGIQFRTGHYFFDTNRDWFAQTQRETRFRVPTMLEWRPQVVVDLHEMGANSEFYFDPPAEPYGRFFPDFAKQGFVRFGQAYAEAFDRAGFEYMTRERFNFFYPGYTTSFGSYQGAVGMLYEQGSTRGLALQRADESVRLLGDALEQHYTAAWTAAWMAAGDREELLTDYYDDLRRAVEDGRTGVVRYLLDPAGDPQLVAEYVNLLRRTGIEVGRLGQEAQLGGVRDRSGREVGNRAFPAGSYVVEAAQPHNRLLRALLEPDIPLPEDFLAEARAREDRGESPRFYDITAWSLPLLFDLDGYSSTDSRSLDLEMVETAVDDTARTPDVDADYAYLIDGQQTASLAALSELKDQGYRAAVTIDPTRVGGHELASGSVVLRVGQNDDSLHAAVRDVAEHFGLEVLAVGTGLSEPGFPTLGSGKVMPVKRPEIALLAGNPVHGYSFGWAWYVLDRQYEIPLTVRQVRSLASTPIHRFDVLVIPHLLSADDLASTLGEKGIERLQQWVRDGGSLVALGSAVDFVREHLELSALRSWYEDQKPEGDGEKGEEAPEPAGFDVPGAILRVELDGEAWLSSGYGAEIPALVTSRRIYLAPEGPPDSGRRVVARYADRENLRIAGHLWEESQERLPGSVFAYEEKIDRGRVILFTEDLNFRAYWRGSDRLFLNAVFLSPSAP